MRVFVSCLFAWALMTTQAAADVIPLTRSGNFYSILVSFNGAHPVPMTVDTGASEHVLTDWFAKDANLKLKESNEEDSDSGGSSFKLYRTKISSMQAGPRTRNDLNLAVVHFEAFQKKDGVVGLFSPQTFYPDEPVLIHFPSRTLRTSKDIGMQKLTVVSKATLLSCATSESIGMIEAQINGVSGHFFLDTGGFKSTLSKGFASKLGKLKTENAFRNGIAGKRTVERAKGLQFKTGNIQTVIEADIEKKLPGCAGSDGKLGIDFLSQYGLFLDKNHHEISFIQ